MRAAPAIAILTPMGKPFVFFLRLTGFFEESGFFDAGSFFDPDGLLGAPEALSIHELSSGGTLQIYEKDSQLVYRIITERLENKKTPDTHCHGGYLKPKLIKGWH